MAGLNTASTWFFESLVHSYRDRIEIRVAEGIKASEARLVDTGVGKKLGPYFPVEVSSESRYLSISFDPVLSYQVVSESYGSPTSEMKKTLIEGPVYSCSASSYLKYIESDSLISQIRGGEYGTYFIWTEDQTIFVVALQPPTIEVLDKEPDMTIERGETYFAS